MRRSLLSGQPTGRLLCSCIVLSVLAVPGRVSAQTGRADGQLAALPVIPRVVAILATLQSPSVAPAPSGMIAPSRVDRARSRAVSGETSNLADFALGTRAAAAQQPVPVATPLNRPPDMPSATGSTSLLRGLYVTFAAMQVLDATSTTKALSSGAAEGNPLMSRIASNPGALIAVKAAATASTIFFAERIARKSRLGAIMTMVAFNSVYAMVVRHNYGVANTQATAR